ncbi:MAG TPA: TetR family transcriptional regulator [Solirubrobacteraceae bacterium]|nr:TetR family transcriptional regulator [Solirubrobacteraceae bacterium]
MAASASTATPLAHSRARMEDIQRARLLAAMCEVVAEQGLVGATVARVVDRAGVSRRTFYEQFHDRDECFSVAFEDAIERVSARVLPAYGADGRWLDRLRSGLAALLEFLDRDRRAGRLLLIGSLAAGSSTLERRLRIVDRLVAALDEGRDDPRAGRDVPPLAAEGAVGGALAILHARLAAGDEPLTPLQGQIMSVIVMPYLGPAAARRELLRPIATVDPPEASLSGDALRESGIRLTYRTTQVLLHLARHPGCSNRRLGDAVGIPDQGQVSKLLSRLRRLGFVENAGGPRAAGAPNAWRLTAKGAELQRAVDIEDAVRTQAFECVRE